jgi:LysM repeat protein
VADRSSQRTADHAAPPWEPPRRFEAYPNIRTRPRLEGAGRPPTLAIGVVALAIAALILFLLPGFLGGGSPAGSPTPTAGSSAVASVSPTPVPASPSPTAAVYVVKAGDTLSAIAHRFGLTIEELQAANPQIKNPDRIAIGDEINIPTPAASGSAGTGGASASGGASATTAP